MKRMHCALASAALLASHAAAGAQALQAVPAPAATPALVIGAPQQDVLRAGTPIALKTSEELTTKEKKARVGQRFQLEVSEPVMLNGQVVIPAGSPATGEITEVRNKGMWGKSGHLTARLLFVRANGRQIRLTGTTDDKGVTGTAGVVGAVAFVPLAGFFLTGTSAMIPMGAPVKGFIDEDLPVTFAAAAPQPMMVPASAPVAAVQPTAATPAVAPSSKK